MLLTLCASVMQGLQGVVPILNYYDNVSAAQRMMGQAMPSVAQHLNDLVDGQMRITKEMNNIPAKSKVFLREGKRSAAMMLCSFITYILCVGLCSC